jgi:4-amino-4-deoxy-L-arabinose transferase-like glycosyltransferase
MTAVLTPPTATESPVQRQEPTRPRAPSGLRRVWRGRDDDAAWVRPALFALLLATAVLYLWGLGASGWANSYYSAAVQAGTKSWRAFFFGSFDSSNFISVDKSPAALWVMGISARLFGVNAWSILVPQALQGVAAVGVLYATVRRWFSPAAALAAGAVLATSPVAALMFRFNNPDALLVLLLVGGAYAMTRALESGRSTWLLLAFSFVGFGFLAKMLQALLVVPAFGLVYLFAGPPQLGRRIGQLALGAVALVVSAGWWIAAVQLTPASSRPYIGGSQDNSLWNLIFGYNGFGRLTGNETGSVGGGTQGGGQWGPTGILRMFNTEFGGQISWLLPAALILLAGGLLFTLRAPRTDRTRAALLLWGGWLLVTGVAFSLGQGIIHPYYAVALAPAIGALVGIGAHVLWQHRSNIAARLFLAAAVFATSWWSVELLQRAGDWQSWLRPLVLVGGITIAVALVVWQAEWHRAVAALAISAAVVGLAGPAAYAIDTAATPHSGAIPSAGPTNAGGTGAFGGRVPFGNGIAAGGAGGNFGTPPNFAGGGPSIGGGTTGGTRGGLLNASAPSAELTALLDTDASQYRWVAATIGANEAAGYQLATNDAVMAIGGFNGTDPTPTLAQFQQYVADGDIHYFIGGGGGLAGRFGSSGASASASSAISAWVQANFSSTTVGGVTVYDLTASR